MIAGSKIRVTRKDSPLYGKIGLVTGLGRRHVFEEYIVMFDHQISDEYPFQSTIVMPWDVEVLSRYDKGNQVDIEVPDSPKHIKHGSQFIKKKGH